MVEYTIDDIRGPTVAREMAQLKEFVLAQFNNAIADAEAAAAAAAQAVLDSLDARVGALEGDMTTAQSAILTLDGSVVKLAGAQTIPGAKTFSVSPTVPAPTNATDAANKKYVDDADALKLNITDVNNYAVGLTGNQGPITGWKSFNAIEYVKYYHEINTDNAADNVWRKAFSIEMTANKEIEVEIVSGFNNIDTQRAHLYINSTSTAIRCAVISTEGSSSNQASASNYVCVKDGTTVTLYTLKRNRYTNLFASIVRSSGYGYNSAIPTTTWLNEAAVDPSTETHDYIGIGGLIPYRNVV